MKYQEQLIILLFTIIFLSFTFTLNSKKHNNRITKHNKSFHRKASKAQETGTLDDCVVQYNAALFCKFEYPNEQESNTKTCVKDTIQTLSTNNYCAPCIKRLFSKVLGKLNVYISFDSLEEEEKKPDENESTSKTINSLKSEAIKSILSKLLFSTKNCDLAPNNLKQVYVEFSKASGTKKCLKNIDNFLKQLNIISNNTYTSTITELDSCPKVRPIANAMYDLLTNCRPDKAENDSPKLINTFDRKKSKFELSKNTKKTKSNDFSNETKRTNTSLNNETKKSNIKNLKNDNIKKTVKRKSSVKHNDEKLNQNRDYSDEVEKTEVDLETML